MLSEEMIKAIVAKGQKVLDSSNAYKKRQDALAIQFDPMQFSKLPDEEIIFDVPCLSGPTERIEIYVDLFDAEGKPTRSKRDAIAELVVATNHTNGKVVACRAELVFNF